MMSADSVANGAFLRLPIPQLVAELVALVAAVAVAVAVTRAVRPWRAAESVSRGGRVLAAMGLVAPLLAALAALLLAHAVLAAAVADTSLVDSAGQLAAAVVAVRLGVYVLGWLLGPSSWVRSREPATKNRPELSYSVVSV